jgi:hypothetical protein
MALVLGVALAFGVGDLLRRIRWPKQPDDPPAPRKEAIPVVLASLLAIAMSAGYATGAIQKLAAKDSYSGLPGAGLLRENCCLGAAKFLRDLDVEGDVLCGQFGDGGVFEYYFNHDRDKPKRKVFMDGRLEAHTLEKFKHNMEMTRALMKSSTAGTVWIDSSIRFIMIANQPGGLQQLVSVATAQWSGFSGRSPGAANRFRLIYMDHSGAIFERKDWEASPDSPDRVKIPSEPDLRGVDLPLERNGRVKAPADEAGSGTWYNLDILPVDALLGTELLALGTQPYFKAGPQEIQTPPSSADRLQQRCIVLANRNLAAAAQRLPEWNAALAPLAQAYGQRAWQQFIEPSQTLPIDIDSACSLNLYQRIVPEQLNAPKVAAQHYMDVLIHSNLLDEALSPTGTLLRRGGWQGDWRPSMRGLDPGAVANRLEQARQMGVLQLPMLQRAQTLVRDYGLINEAISQLQSPAEDWGGQCHMLLGDLLLRKGLPAQARQAYAQVTLDKDQAWQLGLRSALCVWVDGKLWMAADDLKALSAKCDQPSVKFYRLHLAELLGDVATITALADDPAVKALLPDNTNQPK